MVDWGTMAAAGPGWLVSAYAVLAITGKAPVRFRRSLSEQAHEIVAREERERQLSDIAPLAADLKRLVENQSVIMKTIMPNGGTSLSDKINEIVKVQSTLKSDVEELLREKTYRMQVSAEHAGKLEILTQRVNKIEGHR